MRHGSTEQKEDWLPGIAAGTTRVAFAVTEPDAGTNTHNISTAARKADGRWLLRGTKTYISGVEDAHAILVVARQRLDDGSLGLPLLMLVDSDAPGLERQHIPTALRGADKQWTLFFDDVEVDPSRLIGGETAGPEGGLRRPEPRADHGRGASCGAGRRGLEIGAATPASGWCGTRRSARTRASRTRWPARRSSSSARG